MVLAATRDSRGLAAAEAIQHVAGTAKRSYYYTVHEMVKSDPVEGWMWRVPHLLSRPPRCFHITGQRHGGQSQHGGEATSSVANEGRGIVRYGVMVLLSIERGHIVTWKPRILGGDDT